MQSVNARRGILSVCLLIGLIQHSPLSVADETKVVSGVKTITYYGYQSAIEIRNDHHRVVLCPEIGGRILEYSVDGKNILFVSDDEKNWKPGAKAPMSAGRFDIGPELVVPPRDELWTDAWTPRISGPMTVELTSSDCSSAGVRLVRTFQLDPKSSRLLCTQTIINISDKPHEWCHWSRTFVEGRGICVIPTTKPSRFPNAYVMYEDHTVVNMKPDDPHIRQREDVLEIFGVPRKPKLGFDSSAGVIAYVAPTNLLFVKRFAVDRNRVYNEAAGLTISVWYPDREMVELEPIGPREHLEPGQAASFTEEWWLAPMQYPADATSLNLLDLKTQLNTLQAVP